MHVFEEAKLADSLPAVQLAVCIGLVSRIFGGAARSLIHFLMQMLVLFGSVLLDLGNENATPTFVQKHALRSIPLQLESLEKFLQMDPPTVLYIVCPKCHCLYKAQSPTTPPRSCTDKPFPFSLPCDTALFSNGKPIKAFEYLPFEDWLGRFIAQPDMEEMCDEFCRRVDEPAPYDMKDIEDGPFVRSFPGPVPGTFFIQHRGQEGRLLFSLNVDFFNIEGNLQRGAKRSMGVISLQCLNILDGARQDIGKFYVAGIIPGVDEPSAVLAHIRHYLSPVFQSFVVAFERGHHVAQTGLSPQGRTYRSAILIKVSDAKAARSVGGHADITSHHVCVQCKLWHQQNILRSDYLTFETANCEEYRRLAKLWWEQPSVEAQKRFVETHGMRGSALWELPYWNPVTSLVVDPMHTLARVQQQFARDALRLDKNDEDKKDPEPNVAPFAFRYPFEYLPTRPDYVDNIDQSDGAFAEDDPDAMDVDIDDEMVDPEDEQWNSAVPRPHLSPEEADARSRRLLDIGPRLSLKECGQVYLLQRRLIRGLDEMDLEASLTLMRNYAERQNKPTLEWICADLNCYPLGRSITKATLADALKDWVCSLPCVLLSLT